MLHTKKPSVRNVVDIGVSKDAVERQLVNWIRGVVESNNELVPALERLRHSYRLLLAGKCVTDAEEILWQVENALKDAGRSKPQS